MTEAPGGGSGPPGRLLKAWAHHDKLRFLVVGAWNTVFGYLAFVGLYLVLDRRYMIAAVAGHALAVSQAFLSHRYVTFQSRGGMFQEFLRFNLTYLGSLVLGLAGLPVLVEIFRVPPLLAQAGLILVTMLGSYLLHRGFTFKDRSGPGR